MPETLNKFRECGGVILVRGGCLVLLRRLPRTMVGSLVGALGVAGGVLIGVGDLQRRTGLSTVVWGLGLIASWVSHRSGQ